MLLILPGLGQGPTLSFLQDQLAQVRFTVPIVPKFCKPIDAVLSAQLDNDILVEEAKLGDYIRL